MTVYKSPQKFKEAVQAYNKAHPLASVDDIAAALGVSRPTVSDAVARGWIKLAQQQDPQEQHTEGEDHVAD